MSLIKFCLPPKDADEFKRQIISGEIDPIKLAEMTSKERHQFFAKRFGDSAAGDMNRLLETKLLLKNQQQGMVNWAKKMMGQNTPATRDVVQKVKGMTKLLSPADEDKFLEELVAHKLGTRISFEEAKKIAELSKAIDTAKKAMATGGDRMAYGRAVVNLRNYVNELKLTNKKLTMQDLKSNPINTTKEFAKRSMLGIGGNAKSIKSSLDNSALLRQGLPVLITHPVVWQKSARHSFVNLVKAFGSDQVMNEVMAEILSRPTYDLMRQAKVDLGVREEAYPESLAEKVPGIGRAFRASEVAYKAFLTETRADLFELYLRTWKASGIDVDKEELLGIGTLVNTLTGRGHLGSAEPAAQMLNNLFFSPRNMAAHVNRLTAHIFDPTATSFTRKQAAINLTKLLAAFAMLIVGAKLVNPKINSGDPLDSTFGKAGYKINTLADVIILALADSLGMSTNTFKGKTTVDLTGGAASYAVIGARMATTLARATAELTGHHQPKAKRDTWEDMRNFMENKLSPVGAVTKTVMRNKDFNGNKPTPASLIKDLAEPLPAQNLEELEQNLKKRTGSYVTPFGASAKSK